MSMIEDDKVIVMIGKRGTGKEERKKALVFTEWIVQRRRR